MNKNMGYFKHLYKNWKVCIHAINDFIEHFLHGLIPAIKWNHYQKTDEYFYNWLLEEKKNQISKLHKLPNWEILDPPQVIDLIIKKYKEICFDNDNNLYNKIKNIIKEYEDLLKANDNCKDMRELEHIEILWIKEFIKKLEALLKENDKRD